jgi:hypothetical protein
MIFNLGNAFLIVIKVLRIEYEVLRKVWSMKTLLIICLIMSFGVWRFADL